MDLFAHSRENTPMDEWQSLQDHCKAVAGMSAAFAAPFTSGEHGRILGSLHDLGKAHAHGVFDCHEECRIFMMMKCTNGKEIR